MTNFEKVRMLNKAFARATTNIIEFHEDFEQSKEKINSQIALIQEEFDELCDSVSDRSWNGIIDAVGDILVVTYGLAHVLDIDCDKLMDNISKANFSKFCTHEEIDKTRNHYASLGVKTDVTKTELLNSDGEELYAIVSECDQTDVNGKFIPNRKLLKNVNWFEPDLNVERD